jgi:hypothetical protein
MRGWGWSSWRASVFGGAVLLAGLALANMSCGGPDDTLGEPGAEAAVSVGGGIEATQGELRRRGWWRPRWTTPTPQPTSTTGTGGASGGTGTVGASSAGISGGGTPTPSGGGTDPSSGVDSSNSGGRCPNNRPMPEGGPCGPYGINCTYDTDTASHLCICLNSSSTGKQGWGCR